MRKSIIYRSLSSILLIIMMVLGLVSTSFAADSKITYKGRKSGFEFTTDSVYLDTDLFDNFKQVMPGDVKEEKVTIVNKYAGCDYVVFHMTALLHDEEKNPISPVVLEKLTADERRKEMSELDYMHDFLSQLTLTVWNGEKTDENIIYKGSPDALESGFEGENVYIGSLGYGRSVDLNVELAVSHELGNEYADRIGEVDWVFVIAERNTPSDDDDPKETTKDPAETGEWEEDVLEDVYNVEAGEEDIDFNLQVLPKTGDETAILPYVLLLVAALTGMVMLIAGKRKKNTEQ